MQPRSGFDLDVLEASQMLWRWLDYGKKPEMRPIGGSPALDIARAILQLILQPPNREGFRWWKLRVGAEERLRRAGIHPETGALLDPQKWQLAVDRGIGELQDRKARRALYRQKRAAAVLETRRGQIYQPVANFDRQPNYEQRLQVGTAGLMLEEPIDAGIATTDQDLCARKSGAGGLSFGYIAPPNSPPIATSSRVIPGPPHQRRRVGW